MFSERLVMWVFMVVIMVGGSLLFCLVTFLYVCNTFNLAVVTGGPGHGTGRVADTDQTAGQYSQHYRVQVQDGSSLTKFQTLDYTRHVLGAGEVLKGRLDVFHAASAEF